MCHIACTSLNSVSKNIVLISAKGSKNLDPDSQQIGTVASASLRAVVHNCLSEVSEAS
jgi:hypothetical protein